MSKLYELSSNYLEVASMMDEDCDNQVLMDTLASIEGEIEEKAGNIAKFVKSMEYDIGSIKAEEKRLSERRKAIENRRDSIKAYVQMQMEIAKLDKIKTPTMTLSIQKNLPAVQIEDEAKIPAAFMTVIPEQYVPDKNRIKEALKSGDIIPGATLTQGKSLRIR